MPPIRFLASKCRTCVVAITLLLGKIMPTYSRCVLKGLVYITITASFYTKYTKSNIYLFYNIKLVFNAKYMPSICLANF